MPRESIDFRRGQLVGAAQAVLLSYRALADALHRNDDKDVRAVSWLDDRLTEELARLVHNNSQLHGNDIGDPVQLSITILLMAGFEVELPRLP